MPLCWLDSLATDFLEIDGSYVWNEVRVKWEIEFFLLN